MKLKQYLKQHYQPRTASQYQQDIEKYISTVNNAPSATYPDITNYLEKLRGQGHTGTLPRILSSIKAYYRWLQHTGQRENHPCSQLVLKTTPSPPMKNLFTPEELEALLQETATLLRENQNTCYRDQAIISLLIYQGLSLQNLINLETEDLRLEQATLYVRPTPTLNPRTLPLHPRQIMILHHYIEKERPQLHKHPGTKLLITRKGSLESGNSILNILSKLKHLCPGRQLSALTLRQSVIANLLNSGKSIRVVQEFSGHHQSISVEKYRKDHIEALKNEIQEKHPLG